MELTSVLIADDDDGDFDSDKLWVGRWWLGEKRFCAVSLVVLVYMFRFCGYMFGLVHILGLITPLLLNVVSTK